MKDVLIQEGSVDIDRSTQPTSQGPVRVPRIEIVVEREGGQQATRTVVLDGDVLRVGSGEANELVLSDPQVSRLHCQVRNHPRGWRLVDTGSLNGTRVGGVRVRDADLSLPECVIELGQSVLRVRGVSSGQEEQSRPPALGSLFGASPLMQRMFDRIERVAKTDTDVLIQGESGTGKELIAAEIVRRSPRAGKPFVIVDCGAISPTLIESELFGHAKGAFTGAEKARAGAFESADGGTVFLDDIGELPIAMQPKLLRALAAREVRRLGENESRKIDVRVVAATNRRLEAEINQGRFREDLYYRLSVLRIDVPPLRERLEDLRLLVGSFLEQLGHSEKMGLFTDAIIDDMRRHNWPGNVRELRNYVERITLFEDATLETRQTSPSTAPDASVVADIQVPFRKAKDELIRAFEQSYLSQLLTSTDGNVSQAARDAKLDRMYLHRLLQRHGLRRSDPLED